MIEPTDRYPPRFWVRAFPGKGQLGAIGNEGI
jgi:hypothetical protein